ncbi:MAG TPA: hypothetical protein VKA73_10230 [Rubrobacter sp.]|nr:hypothetical protein [Rubrobacter sp.]
MTPAEERFGRARQTSGLFLGPVVFLVLLIPGIAKSTYGIVIALGAIAALLILVVLLIPVMAGIFLMW